MDRKTLVFFSWLPAPIDQTGDKPRAKPVVDIYYGDIRSARVQHSQQRSDPTKRCTVADTRWHGHDRNTDQTTDHGWQCAFHAGRDNHDARTLQQVPLG